MPAWVEPVTEQTMTLSKRRPELGLLVLDLEGPARETVAAQGVVRRTRGDRVRGAAALASTSARACSHEGRMPMSKVAGSSRTSAPIRRLSRMLPVVS